MGTLHFLHPAAEHHYEYGAPLASEASAAGVDEVAADPRLQACVQMEQGQEVTAMPPIAAHVMEHIGTKAVFEDIRSAPGRSLDDFEVGKALYEEQLRGDQ